MQMSTFIFLISDLVIINHKGELDSNLSEMIKLCFHSMSEIEDRLYNDRFEAKQLLFVLRDQYDGDTNKQISILSNLISSIGRSSYIDYKRYVKFDECDIYPLQSAFMLQNINSNRFKIFNNIFGKSILALRTKLMSYLKVPTYGSII